MTGGQAALRAVGGLLFAALGAAAVLGGLELTAPEPEPVGCRQVVIYDSRWELPEARIGWAHLCGPSNLITAHPYRYKEID